VRNARRPNAPDDDDDDDLGSSFSWSRWCVSLLTGSLGAVVGFFVGFYGGALLDEAMGHPLGKSGGFISFGFLTVLSVVGGTALGTALGALGGHSLLEGEGGLGTALVAALLGLGAVAFVLVGASALVLPALLLLPLFAATGLEFASSDEGS
jgi:hypothetical protein